MNEPPKFKEASDRVLRPQKSVSFESQLEALPPDVRSVAESLAQYLAANRG